MILKTQTSYCCYYSLMREKCPSKHEANACLLCLLTLARLKIVITRRTVFDVSANYDFFVLILHRRVQTHSELVIDMVNCRDSVAKRTIFSSTRISSELGRNRTDCEFRQTNNELTILLLSFEYNIRHDVLNLDTVD